MSIVLGDPSNIDGYFLVFAVINAAFIPVVYFFYPETALKVSSVQFHQPLSRFLVLTLNNAIQPLESIDTIFSSPDKNKIGTGEDALSRGQGHGVPGDEAGMAFEEEKVHAEHAQ